MERITHSIAAFRAAMNKSLLTLGAFLALSGGAATVYTVAFPIAASACHCEKLITKKVDDTTYQFNVEVVLNDVDKVTKVIYDFGDGTTETKTSEKEAVKHTYTKAGTYKIKTSVHFSNGQVSDEEACAKKVTVPPQPIKEDPLYACTGLTPLQDTSKKTSYHFTAVANTRGEVVLRDASFDFGDGSTAANIKPKTDKPSEIVIDHNYAKEGKYAIVATLYFTAGNDVKTATCTATISIEPTPAKECKPGIPEGDSRCKDTPTTIPSTGPADILASAAGLSAVTGASVQYIRSRRELAKRKTLARHR